MQRQGDQVLVFAPGEGIREYEGAVIERMPGARFPLYPELILAVPRARIRKRLLDFQPDVIHVADPAMLGVAGVYYADVLGLPLIVSYHTRLPSYVHYYGIGALEPLVWKLMKLRHSLSDINLCTSPAMAEELTSHGIDRVQLWPQAVDTEGFHPRFASRDARERLTQGHPDSPLFIYVGRLSPEKGIEKIRHILDAIPEARVAIIGGGPHKSALKTHFNTERVFFVGYLTGRSLSEAMASADALVLPSTTETLGLVLLEAMASGSLVIGANAGGIPHIIQDGISGFLFDPAREETLVEMARRAITQPEMTRQIRERARAQAEECNWTAATRALKGYYATAIQMPRREKKGLQYSPPVRIVKRAALGSVKLFLR